jgi:hypothetical protein
MRVTILVMDCGGCTLINSCIGLRGFMGIFLPVNGLFDVVGIYLWIVW